MPNYLSSAYFGFRSDMSKEEMTKDLTDIVKRVLNTDNKDNLWVMHLMYSNRKFPSAGKLVLLDHVFTKIPDFSLLYLEEKMVVADHKTIKVMQRARKNGLNYILFGAYKDRFNAESLFEQDIVILEKMKEISADLGNKIINPMYAYTTKNTFIMMQTSPQIHPQNT